MDPRNILYIEIAHRYKNVGWERGRAVSFMGTHKLDFRYSVVLVLDEAMGQYSSPSLIYPLYNGGK
jgi:hypothetical protein